MLPKMTMRSQIGGDAIKDQSAVKGLEGVSSTGTPLTSSSFGWARRSPHLQRPLFGQAVPSNG
jgi:hypothetical protein